MDSAAPPAMLLGGSLPVCRDSAAIWMKPSSAGELGCTLDSGLAHVKEGCVVAGELSDRKAVNC